MTRRGTEKSPMPRRNWIHWGITEECGGRKGAARRPSVFCSRTSLLGAFDQDQLSLRRLLPQLDERRVLGRAVPLLRLLHRRELERDHALGLPPALERL